MKNFKIIILVLALTGCFKKTDSKSESSAVIQEPLQKIISTSVASSSQTAETQPAAALLNKNQREAIYFAASLEKEAIKLLTKNSTFDGPTLFSVLRYVVEANSGVKNKAPSPLDCSRYRIDTQPKNEKVLQVFKICQMPKSVVAEISLAADSDAFSISFFVKEWISVLGYSATLGGNEIKCVLKILNKKLEHLSCDGWNRMLNLTASSAEELRLKTFLFERQGAHQFVLKGGIYKDLVEHKKIEVYVPMEGKIKRIENEIEVIDQYLDGPAVTETRTARLQIKPNPQDKNPEPEGDLHEKESQQKSKSENPGEKSGFQEGDKSQQKASEESREKSSETSSGEKGGEANSSEKNIEARRKRFREESHPQVDPSAPSYPDGSQSNEPSNGSFPPGQGR